MPWGNTSLIVALLSFVVQLYCKMTMKVLNQEMIKRGITYVFMWLLTGLEKYSMHRLHGAIPICHYSDVDVYCRNTGTFSTVRRYTYMPLFLHATIPTFMQYAFVALKVSE